MFKDHFGEKIAKCIMSAFYSVNDNKKINIIVLQTTHCILCHNNPILNLNPKTQIRKCRNLSLWLATKEKKSYKGAG
jgi:hypothetical protein